MSSAPDFRIAGEEPDHDVTAVRGVLEAMGYEGDTERAAAGVTEETHVVIERQEKAEWIRLHKMDTAEFTNIGAWEWVQQKFGAGKYRVQIRKRRGAVLTQMTMTLGAPLVPIAAAPAAAESSDRVERLERLVEKLLERGASPAAQPAPGFFEAVATVSKAMGDQNAGLLRAIIEMKSGGDRGASSDKLFDVLLRGIELGKENAGDGGSFARTLGELVPTTLRTLQDLAAQHQPRQPGELPGPQYDAPPMKPASPSSPAPSSPATPLPAWAQVIAPQMHNLLGLATMHARQEVWADIIIERTDVESLTFIEDQLQRGPAFREEFFQVFPDAIKHRSWFEVLFDELTQQLAEQRAHDAEERDE